jgi:hypothetical protein
MPRRRSNRASARLRPEDHMFTTCLTKTILNVARPARCDDAAVKVDETRSVAKSNEGVLEDRAPFRITWYPSNHYFLIIHSIFSQERSVETVTHRYD